MSLCWGNNENHYNHDVARGGSFTVQEQLKQISASLDNNIQFHAGELFNCLNAHSNKSPTAAKNIKMSCFMPRLLSFFEKC